MRSLWTLTRLQLKLRMRALLPQREQGVDWKRLALHAFVGVCLLVLVAFAVVLEFFMMEALKAIHAPRLILSLPMLLVMISCVCISFFTVLSSLYFNRDTLFLASLPVSSRTLMASRLLMVLIGEAGISLLIMGPAIVLYGLHMNAGVVYYVLGLMTAVTTPVLPIALVSALGSLLIRVSTLWKHRDAMTLLGSLALMMLIMYFQLQITFAMPEGDEMAFLMGMLLGNLSFLEEVVYVFPPIRWAVEGMIFSKPVYLLYIAVTLAALFAVIWLLGRHYMQLALVQSEATASSYKRVHKVQVNKKTPLKALFMKEMRCLLRSPTYMFNSLGGAIVMPIMLAFFYIGLQSKNAEILELVQLAERFLAQEENVPIVILALSALCAFISSINPAAATAFSREGGAYYMSRMIPASLKIQTQAKLLMGLSISVIAAGINAFIMVLLLPGLWMQMLSAALIGLLFAMICISIGLGFDMHHPKLDWRTETEIIKQGISASVGVLVPMALLVCLGVLCFIFIWLGCSWKTVLLLMVIGVVCGAVAAYAKLIKLSNKPLKDL